MPAMPSIVQSDTSTAVPTQTTLPVKAETYPELPEDADVLVAGSLAIDLSCDYSPFGSELAQVAPVPHTSNPAIIGQSLGGVGHNVAVAASYVGSDVIFCSVVADDLSGRAALASLTKEGLTNTGIQVLPQRQEHGQHNMWPLTMPKRIFSLPWLTWVLSSSRSTSSTLTGSGNL